DSVASLAEIKRRLCDTRQLRTFRWLPDLLAQHRAELAEGLGGDRHKQGLAVGKMLVGRRLRDAEFLRQRADADCLRAAELDFPERDLNQGIAKIAVMIGSQRFSCGSGRH